MNDDVQDVVRQADLLIKGGKYNSARKLLIPYQSDPMARKRLVWLEQKRQEASQAGKKVNTASHSRQRSRLYVLIAAVIILVVGGLVIYRLSQQNPVPSAEVVETTGVVAVSTVGVSATPSAIPSAIATEIPPTENSQEVSLQQQLRDWLATVEGISQILSFDVDIPGDTPPLVYVEVLVNSGYNDTKIPDKLMQKMIATLNTPEFGDFTIIIHDNQRVIEYKFDSADSVWQQSELSSSITTTAEPAR